MKSRFYEQSIDLDDAVELPFGALIENPFLSCESHSRPSDPSVGMSSSMLSPAGGSSAVSAAECLPPRHALKIHNLVSGEEVHVIFENIGSVHSQRNIAAIEAYYALKGNFWVVLVPVPAYNDFCRCLIEYRGSVLAANDRLRAPGALAFRFVEHPEVQRIIEEGLSIAFPPVQVEEKSSFRAAASCMDLICFILDFIRVVAVLTVIWCTPFRLLAWSIQRLCLVSINSFGLTVQFLVRYALQVFLRSWELSLTSADILSGTILATLPFLRLHWKAHVLVTVATGMLVTVAVSVSRRSTVQSAKGHSRSVVATTRQAGLDIESVSVSVQSGHVPSSRTSPMSSTVASPSTRQISTEFRASSCPGEYPSRPASRPPRPSRDTDTSPLSQPSAPDPDGLSFDEYQLQVSENEGGHRGSSRGPSGVSRRARTTISSGAKLDPPDEFHEQGKMIRWRATEVRTYVKGSSPSRRVSQCKRVAVPAPTILRLPPVESTPLGPYVKEMPLSFWDGEWKPVIGSVPSSCIKSAAPSIPPSPNPFGDLFVADDDEDDSAMYDDVFADLEACLPSPVEGATKPLSEQSVLMSRLPQWKSDMLSKRAARKRRLKEERAAARTSQAELLAFEVAEAALVEDQRQVSREIASAVVSVTAHGGSTKSSADAGESTSTTQAPSWVEPADVAHSGDAVPFDELRSDLSEVAGNGIVSESCPAVAGPSDPPGRYRAAAIVEDVDETSCADQSEKDARAKALPVESDEELLDESRPLVVNAATLSFEEMASSPRDNTSAVPPAAADAPVTSQGSRDEEIVSLATPIERVEQNDDEFLPVTQSAEELQRIELSAEELKRIELNAEELKRIELGSEELKRIGLGPADLEQATAPGDSVEYRPESESTLGFEPSAHVGPSEPSAQVVSVDTRPSTARARPSIGLDTPSICVASQTIQLPKIVAALLSNPGKHAIPSSFQPSLEVAVADSGATDHMVPERSAFFSYRPVYGLRVRMGNNSCVPVMGRGTAVLSLNGKHVMIRNVLHVPALSKPLYSLRAHLLQPGCGFIGLSATATSARMMCVYFPTFVLTVDMSKDCHLAYEPVGRSARPNNMAYVQPKCKPYIYPSERSSPTNPSAVPSSTSPSPPLVHVIEDDAPSVEENGGQVRRETGGQVRQENGGSSKKTGGTSKSVTFRDVDDVIMPGDVSYVVHSPKLANPNTPVLLQRAEYERIQKMLLGMKEMLHNNKSYNTSLSDLSDEEFIERILLPRGSRSPSKSATTPGASTRLLSGMTRDEIVEHLHRADTELPKVRPCDTPNGSDKKYTYSQQELTMAFGGRQFKTPSAIMRFSKDGQLLDGGEAPPSIGSQTTLRKASRGKAIDRTLYKYLDIVHVDIAFGDCMSIGGYSYALILVDRATRYNWVFGLKSLASASILEALRSFKAEAGRLAREFRTDCDEKLFGSAIREYLINNESNVNAAPAGRQSSNGLVESHWKIMVQMARAYLTEKQMPKNFWYWAVLHAARMMNAIPGKYKGKWASPFMLVHGEHPDPRTWVPVFSLCYFRHDKDGDETRSTHMSQTLDGVVLGRCSNSNALLVYNPRNKQRYEPDTYKFDSYRLPCSVYSDLKYDGGLFCSLLRDDNPAMEEKYPPGTRVERLDTSSNVLKSGTVMDIPLSPAKPGDQSSNVRYTILFDDNTTTSIPLSEMAECIPKPPVSLATDESAEASLLPPFLQVGNKITFEHDGAYVKGYLTKSNGVYRFSYKSHPNKKREEWGVNLPDLPRRWPELCTEGVLLPGHKASTFVRSSAATSTFDPVASLVSATNLARDCPPSLLRALADNHPDREVWLQSYYEEKNGIEGMGTFQRLTLGQYRALVEKGAPKAIPSMCVLTVKRDENMLPIRAKSRIVVLGNHEERNWSKSDSFAPVLRQDSLRFLTSLAVEKRRKLKQGDCKNAFCQGVLPPDETTIIRPPSGDPDAAKDEYWLLKKTLYGLRRSPRHWYDKIDSILRSLGLKRNAYDPCLYTGFLRDPLHPDEPPSTVPITLGLYVDDFVFFSECDAVEQRFQRLLTDRLSVDFMGDVEWFLGIHFTWKKHLDGNLSVHMNQAGFAANLVERFDYHQRAPSPLATPYRSGYPIDAIPPSTRDDDDPTQTKRRAMYMSLVGSIGWLVNCTRPDLAPVHKFLASYLEKPALGHEQAAKHVLHYIHSTVDYGISFTSKEVRPMHTYIHFPDSSDLEAYEDACPPSPLTAHLMTTYSDACWGGQFGNAVKDGTQLPLFKYRSMSGGIIFRSGGPIAWACERQDRTSLSSCEAEIRATSTASNLTMSMRNIMESMIDNGFALGDLAAPTTVYNDNESCVAWSHNMTSKAIRHMSLKDNSVREYVDEKLIDVVHVAGKCNPADIFTKEMKDGAQFRRLRDSFMSRLSSFVAPPRQPRPSGFAGCAEPLDECGLFSVLTALPDLQDHVSLSHLSSSGRHMLSALMASVG